jgi:hypothetical protein
MQQYEFPSLGSIPELPRILIFCFPDRDPSAPATPKKRAEVEQLYTAMDQSHVIFNRAIEGVKDSPRCIVYLS